jgi:hypothetical protein
MKLTITRVLETAKVLATEAGQQIGDFISYMAEFVDQVVRALRNGLTFKDNFDCEVRLVSLLHNTAQIVSSTRTVTGIIPVRLVRQDLMLRDFGWYYDDNGRLTVKASFDADPGNAVDVQLVMLF